MHATEAKPWRRQVTAGGRPAPRVRRTGDEADRLKALGPASRADGLLGRLSSSSFSPLVEHVHITLPQAPSQASSSHASACAGVMSRSGRDGDCDHSSVSRHGGNCHDGDYCDYKNIQNLLIIFVGYTRAHAGFGCMKFYNVNCRWHEESECSTSSAHKKNVIMRSVPIKLVH